MKNIFLLFLLIISCKESPQKKTESLCSIQAVDSVNALVDSFYTNRQHLLTSLDKEDPEIINMEKEYLRLLQQREEIQICLASKAIKD